MVVAYEVLGKVLSIIDSMQDSSVNRTLADVDTAMREVEEKARAFTEAHRGESAEEILAQMRGEEPAGKDLEEAAENYSREYKSGESELSRMIQETVKDIFIDGAKWQKRQIMKEAVDGTMGFATVRLEAPNFGDKYKEGDKVKLIIIKED